MVAQPDPPLTDNAIVIRFGVMTLDKLRASVGLCHATQGYWGLSFYGEDGMDVVEIAGMAQKGHRQMQVTQKKRLNDAGFEVERRGRYPHLTLRFESEPSDEQLRILMEAFDPPTRNPHPFVEEEAPGEVQ